MSLFNFVALSLHSSKYLDKINTIKSQASVINKKNIVHIDNNLLCIKKNKVKQHIINYSQYYQSYLATESIYRFSSLDNMNTSLIKELTNKYWQQTIFLSPSSLTTKKYINQLSKQETLLAKNKKKKLLIDFTKALLYGHIETDAITSHCGSEIKDSLTLKYIWKKGLNIKKPKYVNGLWANKKQPDFPSKSQNILLKHLQYNHFPVFTVVNGFKQLVVAEPADKLVNRNNIVNSLYEWYYDRFLWSKDIGGIYEGWFFLNHEDAEEYKHHIAEKYTRSTKQNKLEIMSTGINFYYRLNRTAPPRTEFRLFPDLEEIANLLTKKTYKRNIIFDKRQNHGRFHFQGQPIYIIEPITSSVKNSSKAEVVDYHYKLSKDNNTMKYKAIFLNKDIALQAWQIFRQDNSKYNLPSQPVLRVYNLEDFLKDQEQQQIDDFLFIPTINSYKYIKSEYSDNASMNHYQHISKNCSSYLLTSRLWFNRLIWSLTSRQPPNW